MAISPRCIKQIEQPSGAFLHLSVWPWDRRPTTQALRTRSPVAPHIVLTKLQACLPEFIWRESWQINMNGNHKETADTRQSHVFATTSWKTVLQARRHDNEGQEALDRLLRKYYTPISRIIGLQKLCSPEQTEDLTQEFIKECSRRDFLREVGPDKGRFRTFIRRCLEYFLRDQHVKATAAKRGGDEIPLSLDQTDEEGHPTLDPAGPEANPGLQLDREWAEQVVVQAMNHLEQECVQARRGELFRELKGQLTSGLDTASTAQLAGRLGLSEGAVHVARHRMRQRLGELIVQEVQDTVGDEGDWREELNYLLGLVGK
jgi:RNA polymerase sigma factor (sigma-70 family)